MGLGRRAQALAEVPRKAGADRREFGAGVDAGRLAACSSRCAIAADDTARASRVQDAGRWPHRRALVEAVSRLGRAAPRRPPARARRDRSGDRRRRPCRAAAKITDYQLSRDGSFVTFREDATEKTDYDVISGTDNAFRKLARGGQREDGARREDA